MYEALACLAEAIGDRHAHVVEEQFGCVGGVLPDLVELAAAAKTLAIGFDEDDRHALVGGLRGRIGLGDAEDQIGILAVGDIGLRARADVMISVLIISEERR